MFDLLWRYRKALTVLALIGLAVYILNAQDKDEDEYNAFDHVLIKLTGPLQWLFDQTIDSSLDAWRHYVDNKNAAIDNENIRVELYDLRRKLARVDELQRENTRLRELLSLSARSHDVEYIAARVVARSPSKQYQSLRIARGSADGVERGMGVIAGNGLIGRVFAVDTHFSDVVLLSDTASTIDVVVGRSRARGRLRGLGGSSNYEARIDYLVRSAAVEVGDEVFTTGAGTVFPKGIIIGYVRSVSKVEHGLYQEVVIEPAADIGTLEEVMVVVAFGPMATVDPAPVLRMRNDDWEHVSDDELQEDPLLWTPAPPTADAAPPSPAID